MYQFTIHPSSHHHIIPSSNFQHAKNLRKSAKRICENLRETHHHIITSPHHPIIQLPTSSMQKICEKLITTSPHHHITSFFLISGFSSTKFSGVRLGIKRSERSNISTKKARYNNIIIGFCSERTEYKLKG